MTTAPLILSPDMPLSLLNGEPLRLDRADLTAVLLTSGYVPDGTAHTTFEDIRDHEVDAPEYQRQRIHGARFTQGEASAHFTSDVIFFGDPICLPPVRYLGICIGLPATLSETAPLVGVMDLAAGGPAVEAVRGRFAIHPPEGGWFMVAQVQ